MTEKARIAQVQIGNLQVEGLMLPNGDFGIGVSQISALFKLNKAVATRQVKALLGKGSQLNKTKSELNPKAINYLTLEQFELVVTRLAFKGDTQAQQLVEMFVGLSLTQLWSDAFGVKFEKEQRTQYLIDRMEHRKEYHSRLTKWWKSDGIEYSKDYANRMIDFKDSCFLPKYKPVERFTAEELCLLNAKEAQYSILRKVGYSHDEAMLEL